MLNWLTGKSSTEETKKPEGTQKKGQKIYALSCTFESAYPSRFMSSLQEVNEHIKFTGELELSEGLQTAFNGLNPKKSRFNTPLKISLTKANETVFPSYVYQVLRDFVSKNTDLQQVDLDASLNLSDRQSDELNELAQKNARISQQRTSQLRSLFLLGSVGGFFNALQALSAPLVVIAKALFEGVILSSVSFLRQWYLDAAAKRYDRHSEVNHPSEKQALQLGVKSVSWLNYFKSFLSLSTYQYPRAFAGGLQHAMMQNEDVVDSIMELTPRSAKPYAIKVMLEQKRSLLPFLYKPTTVSSWIAYNDEADFDRQFQRLVQNYQSDTFFLNRESTLTLMLEQDADTPPKFINKYLSNFMIRQGFARHLVDDENIIGETEFENIKKEVQRRTNQSRLRLITGTGVIALGTLLVTTAIPVLIINTLVAAFASKLFSSWRQQYLDYAVDSYKTGKQLNTIKDPSERQALIDGTYAIKNKEYLLSFNPARPQGYRHPVAFAAGMELAAQENEGMVRKIRTLSN